MTDLHVSGRTAKRAAQAPAPLDRSAQDAAWRGRRVFITGHTGFVGTWVLAWLRLMGAHVTGYSLPPQRISLFRQIDGAVLCDNHLQGDTRDLDGLRGAIAAAEPEIILHLAAQSIVSEGYRDPVTTFGTNLLGTVHLLETARTCASVRCVILAASDKCYENRGRGLRYTETDALGGNDPYSASKAASEIAARAFQHSYFSASDTPALTSIRSGNVFGGGDWGPARLIPDAARAFLRGAPIVLRHPDAVRPWLFILDAIAAYLAVVETGLRDAAALCPSYNIGPPDGQVWPVGAFVRAFAAAWGPSAHVDAVARAPDWGEEDYLILSSGRAQRHLGWRPKLSGQDALDWTAEFYKMSATPDADLLGLMYDQIEKFRSLAVPSMPAGVTP